MQLKWDFNRRKEKIKTVRLIQLWSDPSYYRDGFFQDLVTKLQAHVSVFFPGVTCIIETDIPQFLTLKHMEDSGSVKTRVRKDTKRKQFHAGNIFDTIIKKKFKPSSTESLFFLTDEDLYPQDGWTFVFGVTRASLRTIIQSMARHDSVFPKRSTMNQDYYTDKNQQTLDATKDKLNSMPKLYPLEDNLGNTDSSNLDAQLLKDMTFYSQQQQQKLAEIQRNSQGSNSNTAHKSPSKSNYKEDEIRTTTIDQNQSEVNLLQDNQKALFDRDDLSDAEIKDVNSTLLNQNQFYSLEQEQDYENQFNKRQIVYRCLKTACHELCHVFGLNHCPYFECLMNGSNLMEEADRKPFALCPICLRKLAVYHNFEHALMKRYNEMERQIKSLMLPQIEFEGHQQLEGGSNSTHKLFYREYKLFQRIQEQFLKGGFTDIVDETDLELQSTSNKKNNGNKNCWESLCCMCPCLVTLFISSTPQVTKQHGRAIEYE